MVRREQLRGGPQPVLLHSQSVLGKVRALFIPLRHHGSRIVALIATPHVFCFAFVSSLCRTNLPSRTAVRGPGEIEASYVMETIIEHVALKTGVPAHVRQPHSPSVLPRCSSRVPESTRVHLPAWMVACLLIVGGARAQPLSRRREVSLAQNLV